MISRFRISCQVSSKVQTNSSIVGIAHLKGFLGCRWTDHFIYYVTRRSGGRPAPWWFALITAAVLILYHYSTQPKSSRGTALLNRVQTRSKQYRHFNKWGTVINTSRYRHVKRNVSSFDRISLRFLWRFHEMIDRSHWVLLSRDDELKIADTQEVVLLNRKPMSCSPVQLRRYTRTNVLHFIIAFTMIVQQTIKMNLVPTTMGLLCINRMTTPIRSVHGGYHNAYKT